MLLIANLLFGQCLYWKKTEHSQKKDDKLKRKDHKCQIPLAPTQQKDKVQLEIKMGKG